MESELRRLHRLSWLFLTARSVRGLILPAIVVFFASASSPWMRFELLGFLFVIPTMIAALVQQTIYNYRFEANELIVREGILTKKERHIPFDRIHNISIVRNLFHRLLGVASARIETAGGGKPEAVMRVLSLDAVQELRQRALGFSADEDLAGDEVESQDKSGPLLALETGELVRLGLISGSGGFVFAAAGGLLWQLQWWELDWLEASSLLEGEAPAWVGWLLDPGSPVARALQAIVGILILVLALRAFSVVRSLVKFHGFALRRHGGDLSTEFGLLTKVSSLVPVRRIQLISAHSSWLHRCFGRVSIDLEIAGSSEEGSDLEQELAQSSVKRRQYLAPLLRSSEEGPFLREILPEVDLDAVDWQRLSPRARRRILKRTTITTGLLATLLAILAGITPIALHPLHALWVPVIVLPFTFVTTTGWLAHTGWGLSESAIYFRSGWLSRHLSVVPLDKVQTVTVRASPFDRRRRMATLAVDTAGAGSFGHRIDIPYLDREVAEDISRCLYAEAGSTEFDW